MSWASVGLDQPVRLANVRKKQISSVTKPLRLM
jgi:hypothetical protein